MMGEDTKLSLFSFWLGFTNVSAGKGETDKTHRGNDSVMTPLPFFLGQSSNTHYCYYQISVCYMLLVTLKNQLVSLRGGAL